MTRSCTTGPARSRPTSSPGPRRRMSSPSATSSWRRCATRTSSRQLRARTSPTTADAGRGPGRGRDGDDRPDRAEPPRRHRHDPVVAAGRRGSRPGPADAARSAGTRPAPRAALRGPAPASWSCSARFRVESVTWNTTDASRRASSSPTGWRRSATSRSPPRSHAGPHARQRRRARSSTACSATRITYLTPYDAGGDARRRRLHRRPRTEALIALEQGYGAETYFDADGDFVFAPKPADDAPVVWTVDAGELGVMVDASENLDRTGIYNGVLVQGPGRGRRSRRSARWPPTTTRLARSAGAARSARSR